MTRKRRFKFIKDTRFSDNPQKELNQMTAQLEWDIQEKGILIVFPMRIIDFGDCISYRRTFIVEKRKGYKWNDIYEVINKIQAPYYETI